MIPNRMYIASGLLIGFLCLAVMITGCVSSPPQPATPVKTTPPTEVTVLPTTASVTVPETQVPVSNQTPAGNQTLAVPTSAPIAHLTVPAGTPSGYVIAYTAASLKGASGKIGTGFENATPGAHVNFNLDGTQMLKHQVENGAYADVFISASNKYTEALKGEGFFINDTVKELTSNYIIVIVPANNPGKIKSLANLSEPGKRIVMGTPDVPVGMNTRQVIDKLANSTFNSAWKTGLMKNVKSFETTEPGIVTKVSLGEADAGFVYESSYKAAKNGTLMAINIPEKDNALQIYTIGVLEKSANKPAAYAFENFLLSAKGQKILADNGFRAITSRS